MLIEFPDLTVSLRLSLQQKLPFQETIYRNEVISTLPAINNGINCTRSCRITWFMFLNPTQLLPSSEDNFAFPIGKGSSEDISLSLWNRNNHIMPLDEILRDESGTSSRNGGLFFIDSPKETQDLESFFEELSKATTPAATSDTPYPFLDSCEMVNFDEFPAEPIFPANQASLSGVSSRESIDPSIFNFDEDDLSVGASSCGSSVSLRTASQRGKTKFYSRSGQVADPNRGPCHNCKTTLTCYWRKLKGQYHCNACTLFYKRNKYHRSVDEVDKPIKRRNRKSKYDN